MIKVMAIGTITVVVVVILGILITAVMSGSKVTPQLFVFSCTNMETKKPTLMARDLVSAEYHADSRMYVIKTANGAVGYYPSYMTEFCQTVKQEKE